MKTFSKISLYAMMLMLAPLAGAEEISQEQAQILASGLNYQHGKIALRDGLATLDIPADFAFLDAKDAQTVVTKLWGNPPDDEILGMIVPSKFNPLSNQWAVVMTYEESGYIKDDDADKINYSTMLTQMQQGAEEANKERINQGYRPIRIIGWAETPYYDKANHKLYWAKELEFGGDKDHTLNYSIRVLGRRGVLILNAVSDMGQLREVKESMPSVIGMVNFQEGHRYVDFDPKYDKVAGYGLAALILGGVAAKAGLFKGLIALVIAFKKFIIIGVVAGVALIARIIKGKKHTT